MGAVFALFVTWDAVAQHVMPPNVETEYLRTIAVGIVLDANVKPVKISYAITLAVRKPLPEGAIAVLQFENPDPRAAPVQAVYEWKAGEEQFFVISPSVGCIVNGKYYRVVVTLFADRERRDVLSTHEQMVAFSAPTMILKALNVPVECGLSEQPGGRESPELAEAYLQSIINHAPTLKARRDIKAALAGASPEEFYRWGSGICAELRNGRPWIEVRRNLAEFFGGSMAHAMLVAARERICPDLKN